MFSSAFLQSAHSAIHKNSTESGGIDHEKMHRVSGIVPGVMAQTGMETAEIIQGVVAET